jgi:phage tail tape-measure protein
MLVGFNRSTRLLSRLVGLASVTVIVAPLIAGCAGGSLTTREKGAGIGALGGAAAGGIIGSAVRHPGAGAAIGSVLGLGAGALIGDQLQGREAQATNQDVQIQRNQLELERQRLELEELRRRQPEY